MQADEGTDWLLELLTEVQLQQYFLRIRDDLNVTRLSHFEYVKNEDLEKIGMGRPGEFGSSAHPIPPLRARVFCKLRWKGAILDAFLNSTAVILEAKISFAK